MDIIRLFIAIPYELLDVYDLPSGSGRLPVTLTRNRPVLTTEVSSAK